jgi:hypothetical protein
VTLSPVAAHRLLAGKVVGMATCRSCGADIDWMDTADGGRVPLDKREAFAQPGAEAERYVVVDGVARKVVNAGAEPSRTDHRATCPR